MPRYSVDLSINTKGYKEGIDQAKQANNQFDSSLKETNKSAVSVQRELSKTKRAVKDLEFQWRRMSEAERNSATGSDLKAKLDETKKYAADLLDLSGDVNDEIRTMASDTAGLDAMKEGMEIAKSATLAYAGAIAKLTGNEESLKDVVATLTMVENGFNTAIGIANALQKQSALMKGIGILQSKAAALAKRKETVTTAQLTATETAKAAATAAATAATVTETGATHKATIAQAAFNAVAKANPYVILVTTLLALAAAVGGYIFATRKSTEEEKKAQQQAEALKKQKEELKKKQDELAETSAKTATKFLKLQTEWKNLKTAAEKNEWIKNNKTEFENLGISINNINTAQRAFVENSDAVCEAMLDQAIAAKMADQAAEDYLKLEKARQKLQAKYKQVDDKKQIVKPTDDPKNIPDEWKKAGLEAGKDFFYEWGKGQSGSGWFKTTKSGIDKINNYRIREAQKLKKQKEQDILEREKQIKEEYSTYVKESQKASKRIASFGDISTSGSESTKATKEQITYLDKLEKAAADARKELEDLGPNATDEQKTAALDKLEAATKAVKDYKIEIGLETPPDKVDEWEKELKDKLAEAEKKYKLGVMLDDKKMQEEAREEGRIIQDQLDKLSFNVKVKPKVETSEVENIMAELNKPKKKYDFNFLPDKYKDQANDMLDRLNDLTDARQRYNDIIKKGDDTAEIEKAKQALKDTQQEYDNLTAACDRFNTVSSKIGDRVEGFNKFKDTVGDIDNVVQSIDGVVGAFQRLDDAFNGNASGWEKFIAVWNTLMSVMNAVVAVMTVVNAIQDIMNAKNAAGNGVVLAKAAGHSATATAQAAETGTTTALAAAETAAIAPTMGLYKAVKLLAAAQIFAAHASIPFAGPGIAAGYVTAMESLLASLMAFANGGIVGGSSFFGDHMIARVNSGEMILNKNQQKNLFDAIDQNKLGGAGANNIVVTGKIRGKDLLLVQQHYNKLNAKTGQSIKI